MVRKLAGEEALGSMTIRVATMLLAGLALRGAAFADEPAKPAAPEIHGTRLQGTAFLGRHRDVVGATVLVREEGDPSVVYCTTTGDKGAFRVDGLENGSYRVEVRREGLRTVVKSGIELRFPFRAVVELTMEPLGAAEAGSPAADSSDAKVAVRGRARDRDGNGLRAARVRLVRSDGRVDPREVSSAGDGTFSIAELPAGAWRLEARAVGYLPIRAPLEVSSATDLHLSFVRQPAGYEPSPLDLMPEEEPIAPAGIAGTVPYSGLRTAK